jgi:antitoxin PrlF
MKKRTVDRGVAMSAATVTSKGQITIPKEIRTILNLHSGDKVNFIVDESGDVRFVPVTGDVKSLKGIVPKPGKQVSVEEMKNTIRKRGGAGD